MKKPDLKQMTIDEIRQSQIGILDYLDKICRENNLIYYLGGGTLIGAVRHKGYIPWDDDIDLYMKRDDYEKLILIIDANNSKNVNQRYLLMSIDTTPKYYYPFVKIVDRQTKVVDTYMKAIPQYGVWIDIFILDNYDVALATSYKKLLRLGLKLRLSQQRKIYLSDNKIKNIIKRFIHIFYILRDPCKIAKKIDRLSKCTDKKTEYLYIGQAPVGDKDKFESIWFNEVTELDFEGKKYLAPSCYDQILKHRYGDYMKLPPENERVSNHNYNAFWRE